MCWLLRPPAFDAPAFEDREGRAERHSILCFGKRYETKKCGALIGEALDSLRRPV